MNEFEGLLGQTHHPLLAKPQVSRTAVPAGTDPDEMLDFAQIVREDSELQAAAVGVPGIPDPIPETNDLLPPTSPDDEGKVLIGDMLEVVPEGGDIPITTAGIQPVTKADTVDSTAAHPSQRLNNAAVLLAEKFPPITAMPAPIDAAANGSLVQGVQNAELAGRGGLATLDTILVAQRTALDPALGNAGKKDEAGQKQRGSSASDPAGVRARVGNPFSMQPQAFTLSVAAAKSPLFQVNEPPILTPTSDAQPIEGGLTSGGSSVASASIGQLRVAPPQIIQQVTAAIVQSTGGTTEIALNPEELGRVRISITPGEAGLSVSILAERPEVTDLMRRYIELLTRELRDLGHENITFDFDSQSNETEDREGSERGNPTTGMQFESLEKTESPNPIHSVRTGGLDLKL